MDGKQRPWTRVWNRRKNICLHSMFVKYFYYLDSRFYEISLVSTLYVLWKVSKCLHAMFCEIFHCDRFFVLLVINYSQYEIVNSWPFTPPSLPTLLSTMGKIIQNGGGGQWRHSNVFGEDTVYFEIKHSTCLNSIIIMELEIKIIQLSNN